MLPRATWLIIFFSVLIWSGIMPADRMTWWLEVMPALAAIVILFATGRRFPLTALAYILILIHSVILMVGGHFTYAEVPYFDWLWELLGQQRNNYDKIGHFAQGFIPAIIARELLIRHNVISGRKWLAFLVVSVCLAISAFYELLEWWVALLSGESAEAFLGTQGYIWDTQSDMGLALLGAILALALLSGLHNRQINRLQGKPG